MHVGFRSGLFQDRSRPDWGGAGPRPISWSAWYPAAADAITAAAPDAASGGGLFATAPVAVDAPLRASSAPYPTVVLSHGTGGSASELGWLGHRLAQRGYAAFAPNHHGNTREEPFLAEGFICWWERARDMSVLLDALGAAEPFAGRIDTARAAVVGFSLGANTALSCLGAVADMELYRAWAADGPFSRGPSNFPDLRDRFAPLMEESAIFRASWERRGARYLDPRVRAALLLAPAPLVRAFTPASLKEIATPVHILAGGADRAAPVEIGGTWLVDRLPTCSLDIVAPAAGHLVFLSEGTEAGRETAPELFVDAPGVDRRAVHEAIAKAAERLFGDALQA